ncbi:uncharacterized protein LOC120435269 [Oreochromis aureus]|uniref:uncharacterized protein LOC120435269 n=1 Tax=Oreochromis aureus TaxID=47969 RepID=UPI0019535747|nr:uncharacterized protein LOC120435269 [Oreochromis aureus]
MESHTNRRRSKEYFERCAHLKLDGLKEAVKASQLENKNLSKMNIPPYPKPEFHVSHLKHDTSRGALCQIKKDGGFKDPCKDNKDKLSLVWWSLAVAPEEIRSAERRLLEETFPNRSEEQAWSQQRFLRKFASSPAFSGKSMYGSYRFTFTVEEVLKAYSEQFCSGMLPVMRVFKTSLYKQQVMYAVLIHSQDDDENFKQYPRLPNDPNAVCAYRDGRFIWRPEAMCETHCYRLSKDEKNDLLVADRVNYEFYVWDHVALALHVKSRQVLKFDSDDLGKNLSFCERDESAPSCASSDFDTYKDAQKLITSLWSPKEEEDLNMLSMGDLSPKKRRRDD